MPSICVGALLLLAHFTEGQVGVGKGYLGSVRNEADFDLIASPSSALPSVDRSTKCIVPVRDGDPDLLPVLFQNTNVYPKHREFLGTEFPDKFPGLDDVGYRTLCEERATRKYYACVIFRFKGDPQTFGFDIFTGDDAAELPRPEEVKWIHEHLKPLFAIGVAAYSPLSPHAIQNAEGWTNPDFPINFAFGGGFGPYIPYTLAENYGRVRVLNPAQFQDANESGEISSQDILVLDEAPSDIEGVMAAVITGSVQTELSHLSIRTGRRGTPNAYVRDAAAAFAPYAGKLIKLTVGSTDYSVADATLEEAESWWSTHRPKPVEVPAIDEAYESLDSAEEIPLDGSLTLNGRYGGKGANFGRLWHLVPEENRDNGFVIPMHYYFQYIRTAKVPSRANPGIKVALEQYIQQLLVDPSFRGNSHTRFVELQKLRDLFEGGVVDPAIVKKIAERIQEVFGITTGRVRFRSSSNAEHLLEFNGAGLYESTWACAADDLDADESGPSRCDAGENKERGIARGLKRVWGSLWSFRGYEEREYFGIPQTVVGMGILASESFGDVEQANAVAFTGNPVLLSDKRYFVNCQTGDIEVVLPPPGVESEVDLLKVENGLVTTITRAHASNQMPPGQPVLDDDQLRAVGKVMAMIHAGFPFDPGNHPPDTILRDIEFKINDQGRLVFKDVRLFVIVDSGAPAKEYKLVVPDGLTLCGSFVDRRPGLDALRGKLMASVRAGEHLLRSDGSSPADVFEWLDLGEHGPRLEPLGPGTWTAKLQDRPGFGPVYTFDASQDFMHSGELIRVTLANLNLRVDGPEEIALQPIDITWSISPYLGYIEADYGDPPDLARVEPFLPCDLTYLPRYTVDIEFAGGDTLHLEERFQDLEEGTGPAELVGAEVTLAGEARSVNDYWHLVYTAGHHNDTPYPEYWVVFDPPWDVPGIGVAAALQIVQGSRPPPPTAPPQAYLLAEDFTTLAQLDIVSLTRLKEGINPLIFRRGDVDFDGEVRITDPILILRSLFLGEGNLPCPDAADVDDLGDLGITDPILLLEYLYAGGEPPAPPFPDCGEDDLEDDLMLCNGVGCR